VKRFVSVVLAVCLCGVAPDFTTTIAKLTELEAASTKDRASGSFARAARADSAALDLIAQRDSANTSGQAAYFGELRRRIAVLLAYDMFRAGKLGAVGQIYAKYRVTQFTVTETQVMQIVADCKTRDYDRMFRDYEQLLFGPHLQVSMMGVDYDDGSAAKLRDFFDAVDRRDIDKERQILVNFRPTFTWGRIARGMYLRSIDATHDAETEFAEASINREALPGQTLVAFQNALAAALLAATIESDRRPKGG
jgi:hypothetical protein